MSLSSSSSLYTISEKPRSILQTRGESKHADTENVDIAEVAQKAANQAIHSVELAMSQVRTDNEQKKEKMARLQSDHDSLRQTFQETEKQLARLTQELMSKNEMLQQSTEKHEELFRSLRAEQSAFNKLKDQLVEIKGSLKEVERENKDLILRQGNEKSVREELLTEIENMQVEINTLDLEKSKFQHQHAELEMKLRIEMDNFEAEKQQWKEKQMKFLKKMQSEEQMIHAEQQKNSQLLQELESVVERNEYLEHQLRAEENRLKEITKEYNQIQTELERLRQVKTQILDESKQKDHENRNVSTQLKSAEQELRMMAEKVFGLMNQLQKMDDSKHKINKEHMEAKRSIIMYQRKHETMKKAHDKLVLQNKKLTTSVESTKQRLEKLQRTANSYKKKYLMAEKSRKELVRSLRGQQSLVKEIKSRNMKQVSQLQRENTKRKDQIQQTKTLEQKIKTLDRSERALKHQIEYLEGDRKMYVKALQRQENTISMFKQKENLFEQLKIAVMTQEPAFQELQSLEAFEAQMQNETAMTEYDGFSVQELIERAQQPVDGKRRKDAPKRSRKTKSPTKRASRWANTGRGGHPDQRHTKQMIRKLMKTNTGRQLATVLKRFGVSESQVVAWSVSPSEFFKGLSSIVSNITQDVGLAGKAQERKEEEIEILSQKTKDLIRRLEESEESKTKAILRLASILSKYSKPSQGINESQGHTEPDASSTFLTQGSMGVSSASLGSGDPGDDYDIAKLDLSSNAIEDVEVEFIAQSMKDNPVITQLNLSHNNIRGNGLMQLVVATLSEKSACELLDLRYNQIRLSGLEVLVNFIQHSSGMGGILSSCLSEERGKKLVPHIVIRTQHRTIAIDLRHNPLFEFRTPPQYKMENFLRYGAILSGSSVEDDVIHSVIPRDVDTRDDMDEQQPVRASKPKRSSHGGGNRQRQAEKKHNLMGGAARRSNKTMNRGDSDRLAYSGRSDHFFTETSGSMPRQSLFERKSPSRSASKARGNAPRSSQKASRSSLPARGSRGTASMPALGGSGKRGSNNRFQRMSKGGVRGASVSGSAKKNNNGTGSNAWFPRVGSSDRMPTSQVARRSKSREKLPRVKGAWK